MPRKAPILPAKEFDLKDRRKGLDGKTWVVTGTRDRKRWVPYINKKDCQKKKGMVYLKSKNPPCTSTRTKKTTKTTAKRTTKGCKKFPTATRISGQRRQVWEGKADCTRGGLRKKDLRENKQGKIVPKSSKIPEALKEWIKASQLAREVLEYGEGEFMKMKKTAAPGTPERELYDLARFIYDENPSNEDIERYLQV